jgi:hypothetical protein
MTACTACPRHSPRMSLSNTATTVMAVAAAMTFSASGLLPRPSASSISGTIRTVMPLAKADERAGLLSAFYVEGYLAFSLPAILTGLFAPVVGLPLAADIYGAAVILLAVASLLAASLSRDTR